MIAAALLYAMCAVGVALINLRSMSVLGLRGVGAVVDGLLAVGLLVPPLFGILLASGVVSGSREQGSLAMVAAQPVSRRAIAWGIYIGVTATVWASVAIGIGLAAVVTAPAVTATDLPRLAVAAGATLLAGTAGVGLGVLVSTLSGGRAQATAIAVAVWFLIALGIDVVLVTFTPVGIGPMGMTAVTIANPIAALRTLALLATDPTALGPFQVFLEERLGMGLSLALFTSALLAWLIAPVGAASWSLRRRDI